MPALKGLPSLEALAIIRAGDMSALEFGNMIAAAPKLDMLLLFGGGGSEPFKWPSGPRVRRSFLAFPSPESSTDSSTRASTASMAR